jgi:glucan phosphoethanolaminetransferase (alkaline phosphatase superfamily)
MALRLFHVTEFAHTMLSPADQRDARHPALLLLLASLWLALAGNLPLWRELARLPMDMDSLAWIGLCFALITAAALGLLLSLLNWPWLLKLSVTLLLWLAALNTLLLWTGHAYLSADAVRQGLTAVPGQLRTISPWQTGMVFVALALLPSLWVWRLRLRRVALPTRLPQNLLLGLFCACVLAGVWLAGQDTLLPLLQDQPRWLELISPFNTLLSLRN